MILTRDDLEDCSQTGFASQSPELKYWRSGLENKSRSGSKARNCHERNKDPKGLRKDSDLQ